MECEWLRVALFTFIEVCGKGKRWWELVQRIVGQMPPEQMTALVQSLKQQAASLLNGLAVSYSRAVNKLSLVQVWRSNVTCLKLVEFDISYRSTRHPGMEGENRGNSYSSNEGHR